MRLKAKATSFESLCFLECFVCPRRMRWAARSAGVSGALRGMLSDIGDPTRPSLLFDMEADWYPVFLNEEGVFGSLCVCLTPLI